VATAVTWDAFDCPWSDEPYDRHRSPARKDPEQARADSLKKYGLTLEQYDRMAADQGHVCAICGQPETATTRRGVVKHLAVDHDHTKGLVAGRRGLLCTSCNVGLGAFNDDPELLVRALEYLARHRNLMP
jgi:hypothetical protein